MKINNQIFLWILFCQVEQLHKIFKLCGSPPDDYTTKLRLTTSFRARYIPTYEEVFSAFPSSSFGLLTQLLALDPASRGTATSALQNHVSYIFLSLIRHYYVSLVSLHVLFIVFNNSYIFLTYTFTLIVKVFICIYTRVRRQRMKQII